MIESLLTGGLGMLVMVTSMSIINEMNRKTQTLLRLGYVAMCTSGFIGILAAVDVDLQWLELAWWLGAAGACATILHPTRGADCAMCLFRKAVLRRKEHDADSTDGEESSHHRGSGHR